MLAEILIRNDSGTIERKVIEDLKHISTSMASKEGIILGRYIRFSTASDSYQFDMNQVTNFEIFDNYDTDEQRKMKQALNEVLF